MNSFLADQFLMSELGVFTLDQKICQKEVKAFRCCFDLKGQDACKQFLELVGICYQNKGRKVKRSDEF
jgi:hypothetical protein